MLKLWLCAVKPSLHTLQDDSFTFSAHDGVFHTTFSSSALIIHSVSGSRKCATSKSEELKWTERFFFFFFLFDKVMAHALPTVLNMFCVCVRCVFCQAQVVCLFNATDIMLEL